MNLICSAGHKYDTENISHVWWKGERSLGGRCPEVLSYDRMTGSHRCCRTLYEMDENGNPIKPKRKKKK